MRNSKPTNTQIPSINTVLANRMGLLFTSITALILGLAPLHQNGRTALGGLAVATTLTLATCLYGWRQFYLPKQEHHWFIELEPPFLLLIFTWTIFRFGEPFIPHLIVGPALVISWITIRYRYRRKIWLSTVTTIMFIEMLSILTGNRPANDVMSAILVCTLVAATLHRFPGSKIYKSKLRKERRAADRQRNNREHAQDLGLPGDTMPPPDILRDVGDPDLIGVNREQTIKDINKSFELQIEILRAALELTSVAVLWSDPIKESLRLRYLATSRSDIDPGPYPKGTGIIGALNGPRQEIELSEVKSSHPDLPYYRENKNIGAIMALKIPIDHNEAPEKAKIGILCVDREKQNPWSDKERRTLRFSAQKLGMEIDAGRKLLNMDQERTTIHRLFHGLRELNSGPDLDSIFASSIKAVKTQLRADLLVLCLKDNDRYRIVQAEGGESEKLLDQEFKLDDGLVGQVIKTRRTLPANGRYQGKTPVFGDSRPLPNYRSLLACPLSDENNSSIGCLVAATESTRAFTKSHKEILEIIADQIAIKVKLGQAHEQLSLMATSDGLTGLVNHRTFQHGCSKMIERAGRNRDSLCLILGDLDRFKTINDRHGHPFGDEVLRKVANVITNSVRTVDLAARYGGEEFAIALENCDTEGGLIMAERIREKIALLNLFSGNEKIPVTISLGIAVFPESGENKAELIAHADRALYRAKKEGRNRTVLGRKM